MEGIEELEETEVPEKVKAPSPPAKPAGKSNAQKTREVEGWILHNIKRKNDLDDQIKKQTETLNQMKTDNVKKKSKIDEEIATQKIRVYDLTHNEHK